MAVARDWSARDRRDLERPRAGSRRARRRCPRPRGAVDEAFEQAVRGQPIGAVEARAGRPRRPPRGREASSGRGVDGHAADHVVGTRADRDRVAGDVEVEVAAEPVDSREPAADALGVEVREVEVDVGVLGLGHLGGDRQRDVVARGQLGERDDSPA